MRTNRPDFRIPRLVGNFLDAGLKSRRSSQVCGLHHERLVLAWRIKGLSSRSEGHSKTTTGLTLPEEPHHSLDESGLNIRRTSQGLPQKFEAFKLMSLFWAIYPHLESLTLYERILIYCKKFRSSFKEGSNRLVGRGLERLLQALTKENEANKWCPKKLMTWPFLEISA